MTSNDQSNPEQQLAAAMVTVEALRRRVLDLEMQIIDYMSAAIAAEQANVPQIPVPPQTYDDQLAGHVDAPVPPEDLPT